MTVEQTTAESMSAIGPFLRRNLLQTWAIPLLLLWATTITAGEGHGHAEKPVRTQNEAVQTMCPVLIGEKIDPAIYVDYKDRRVYLCCMNCKEAFKRSPDKYLSRLPQFSEQQHSEHKGHDFHLGGFVKPLGIATLTLIVLTACAGLFMRKNRKLLFKWHRRMAFATVALAICHALLVFLFH